MPQYKVDFQYTEPGRRKLTLMQPEQRRMAIASMLTAIDENTTLDQLSFVAGPIEGGFALVTAPDMSPIYAAMTKVNSVGWVMAYAIAELMPPDLLERALTAANGVDYPAVPPGEQAS